MQQAANPSYLKNTLMGAIGGTVGAYIGRAASNDSLRPHPWSVGKRTAIGSLGGAALGAALTPLQRKMVRKKLEQEKINNF